MFRHIYYSFDVHNMDDDTLGTALPPDDASEDTDNMNDLPEDDTDDSDDGDDDEEDV